MSENVPIGEKTFTWDWRQQPPMSEIALAVRDASGGTVRMTMPDTGSDSYELNITRSAPAPAPELAAAIAETRHYREQLDATRKRLEDLATSMEWSASASSPSKKSEIERQCAKAVREAIGGES